MKNKSKKLALAVTLSVISGATLFIGGAQAAESGDELERYSTDEYIVAATRTSLTQKEVPQSVEVIDKEEIENVGALSVRDVLETATNLNMTLGGGGHGDEISLRGGGTDDILFLFKGRRVAGENVYTNGSGNSRILDRLNLSNVERIEIVRGPAGALYGSDAMSGVINIITKKSEAPQFTVGFGTGSREMSNYYHWDTGKQGKVSATFDANFSKLRNFDGKAGLGMVYGPRQTFTLDMDYEMDQENKLNFYLDYTKEKYDYGVDYSSYGYGTSKSHRDTERKTAAVTYEGKNVNSNYSLSATYSQLDSDSFGNELQMGTMPPKVAQTQEDKKYKQWIVEARDTINTAENNKLTFGGEIRVNEGSAYVTNGDTDRTEQFALYLQDELHLSDKWLLVPSVRYDHHDSFGSHTSPNMGVTYFAAQNSRFKVNYGSAYRAPSIDELYGTFNHMGMFTFYGNPDLKPEKSRGFELSYEHEFSKDTAAKLTYFKQKKEDAISYKDLSSVTSPIRGSYGIYDKQFVNIDEASYEGIEFELKQELGNGFTLTGNYDWLEAVDESDGSRLDYTARNTYVLKLQWTEPTKREWSVTAWNKWYSDYMNDEAPYSGNTFHFVVNKRWHNNKYRAFFGIDNLFNKEIDELYYYGRLWRMGFEMTF